MQRLYTRQCRDYNMDSRAAKRNEGKDMSNKIHTLSGTSFHGAYRVTVRGPAEGFILSARQAKKIARAKCDYDGCMCGGDGGT